MGDNYAVLYLVQMMALNSARVAMYEWEHTKNSVQL
jgi:hypothetical protein